MLELLSYFFGPGPILPVNYLAPIITSVVTFLTAILAATVAIFTINKNRKTAREKNALEFELFCQTNDTFIKHWSNVRKLITPMINDDMSIDESIRSSKLEPLLQIYYSASRKEASVKKLSNSTVLTLIPDESAKETYNSILYILNSWERCSNAIRHKVYDEEFIYSAQGTTLVIAYNALMPLIDCRKDKNTRAFLNIEWLATKWELKHTIRGPINSKTQKTLISISEAKTEIVNHKKFQNRIRHLKRHYKKLKKYRKPSF
jgi:hypothetical protein